MSVIEPHFPTPNRSIKSKIIEFKNVNIYEVCNISIDTPIYRMAQTLNNDTDRITHIYMHDMKTSKPHQNIYTHFSTESIEEFRNSSPLVHSSQRGLL